MPQEQLFVENSGLKWEGEVLVILVENLVWIQSNMKNINITFHIISVPLLKFCPCVSEVKGMQWLNG